VDGYIKKCIAKQVIVVLHLKDVLLSSARGKANKNAEISS
jgi:hypothetical protein